MALVPTDQVLETALDYLANDQQMREFVQYIQSEEFPNIHASVERLKEYKDVSAFMCMYFKPQSNRKKYLFSFNWCLNCSFLVFEIHQ